LKATQYIAGAGRHVIVYGGPKTGKTELIGTLLPKYKLHWFNLDNGVKTLFRQNSPALKYLDNLEIYTIPDSQRFPVAVQTLLKVFRGGECKICHKHGIYNCVVSDECKKPEGYSLFNLDALGPNDIMVIDHYTQLMDSVNNWIHKDKLKDDRWDEIKSDYDDWAKHGAMSDRFGSTIQSLTNTNIIVASHEVLSDMEDGTKKITPVGGTRNKSSDFARYFDDVVYTEIVNGEYRAAVSAGDRSRTVIGTRSGRTLKPVKKDEQVSLLGLFE
jgi:hypothetical protein